MQLDLNWAWKTARMGARMQDKEGVQKQIEWRRAKVMGLSSQRYTPVEISKILQINDYTVTRDIDYLRQQSKQRIRKYIDETLSSENKKCLLGINAILKKARNTSQNIEDKSEKIHTLSLAKNVTL
jgi:hypothetical protein